MNGADIFVRNCKNILKQKAYMKHHVPELLIDRPMSQKDIASIKAETGVEPQVEIRVYRPTGSKLHGYFEYAYHKTITR